MAEAFVFQSLSSNSHFRLLEIHPGVHADPIRCSISEWPAQNAPQYEALSYAWGEQDQPGLSIYLSGKTFQVTRELGTALQHLRSADATRTMWIDAICINQADPSERSAQVAMMREIYKGADRVVAWIGEESHDTRRAFAFLLEIAMLRNDDLRNTRRDGVQLGEPNFGDSEFEDCDIDGRLKASLLEDDPPSELPETWGFESDVGEGEPLLPQYDYSYTTVSDDNSQHQQGIVLSIQRGSTALWETVKQQWQAFCHALLHPLQQFESWKMERKTLKLWNDYLEENNNNLNRQGHIISGIPVLYYDFGPPLYDLFTDQRQFDWEALDSLFERAWFSRTWVVQEVWNSTDCIIQCGIWKLKWSTFALAMSFQEGWDDMGYFVKKTKRWGVWPQLKRRYGLAIHIAKRRVHVDGGSSLSDLLWNTWDREATDPRDKVFAILGLLGGVKTAPLLTIDYSKSLIQVYKEAAASIIWKDKKLDLLLAGSGLQHDTGLPSWVPDWRKSGNDRRPALFINGSKMNILTYFSGSTDMLILHGHGYSASGDSEPEVSLSDDLNVLNVRGFVLDIITNAGASNDGTSTVGEMVEQVRLAMDSWKSQQASPCRKPSMDDDNEIRLILRAGTPVSDWDEDGRDNEDEVVRNIMKFRRFLVTEKGYFCIGPALAGKGDVIAIIAGCNFPIVLRPNRNQYNLVGEAYVHHNMAGECLKRKSFFGLLQKDPHWTELSIS